MAVADPLRAQLRDHVLDRLSAVLGQVLTQVLVQVLQELERALEDFDTELRTPEELPKNTGVQSPELKVKQEPQQESCSVSAPWPLETSQVKQEPTDRECSLSDVDDHTQIQIGLVTSLKEEDTCKDRPLSPKQRPDQNPDSEKDKTCSEQLQSGTRGRQNLSRMQKTEPSQAEWSLNDKNYPNKLALKVPIVKLHPLFPKTGSKKEKDVPQVIKTTPVTSVKKVHWAKTKAEERFMCLCCNLFTKENLKIHQTPQEGEDRPFGCPLVRLPMDIGRGQRRSFRQAFNVKREAGRKRTRRFQSKADQRDGESSGEEGSLSVRDTLLNQERTEEEKEVCGRSEEGPDIEEQEGAPLDSADSNDSDDSSDSDDSDDAEVADTCEASVHEANKAGVLFPCDVCGQGFLWLPDLYRHRREHFSKPWWCPDCGRTFRRGIDLRTHTCVETQKPYSCSVCNEAFFLNIQLHTHMKQHRAARRQQR